MYWRIVQFVVQHCPSVILNGILDCGNEDNKDERDSVKAGIDGAKDGEDL